MLRTNISTGLSENLTPTAIAAKNNEVDSVGCRGRQASILFARIEGKLSKTGLIKDFSITAPLTPMLKTTRPSEVSAPRAVGTDNNEVVRGGDSVTDELVKNLFRLQ